MSPLPLSLDAAIGRVPQWAGARDLRTTFLAGGITNQNYRVEVYGEAFVLRIGGANTELLGIHRDNEYAAHRAAAALGIAPEVIYFIQPEGYLVTRFVSGRPIPPEAMRQPENIRHVADTLKEIHALPAIPGLFSPFRTVEDYNQVARRHGVTAFPAHFEWLLDRMREVEAAFLREPFTPRPCHNDLLNENFLIEAGGLQGSDRRLRILDWEYAGMGDVCFDLANFAVHHGFSDEQDRFLLECYFGQATARRMARHKLMKIMSDFREAMWGMVQLGISKLDFDFRGYADKFFDRMTESYDDPRCIQWLTELG